MDDYSLAVSSDDSSDDDFGMTTTTNAASDEGGVGDTKKKVGRRVFPLVDVTYRRRETSSARADMRGARVSGQGVSQPELTGELVDLLRPTVSSGHVSGATTKATIGPMGHCDPNRAGGGSILAALSDSPLVPYAVRTLAVEALTALVARRDVAHAAMATPHLTSRGRRTCCRNWAWGRDSI
jgi:hypothetical protein